MIKRILFSFIVLFNFQMAIAQEIPTGLKINETAPEFKGKDQNGKKISLKNELKNGSVILIFYRGQWCPYCNKQLKALEDSIQLITAKAASVIAITPEKPENITKTIEKTKAGYSILYDKGLKIMKAYAVDFKVDAATIEKYKGYGIDFDKDYRKRPSVAALLTYLN